LTQTAGADPRAHLYAADTRTASSEEAAR
jgi:hypothetical protein